MSEKPTKNLPCSICEKCWAVYHSNQHYCYECGELSVRGFNHVNKKAKA